MRRIAFGVIIVAVAACDLSNLGAPTESAGGAGPGGGATGGGGNGTGASSMGGGAATGGGGANVGGATGGGGSASMHAWPDSETAFCWDGSAEVDCASAPAPQDGTRTDLAMPSYSFGDQNEITVVDHLTGLTWTAAPDDVTYAFDDAPDSCKARASKGDGGIDDWRLPTRLELSSLIDAGASGNKFDKKFAITGSSTFWTSEASTVTPSKAWNVYGPSGGVQTADKTTKGRVLCVSGRVADSTFVLADETVIDPRTGLMWQRNIDNASSNLSWAAAIDHCQKARYGGLDGWRLATMKELQTIVDSSKPAAPLIRDGLGWEGGGTQHWTATPAAHTGEVGVFIMVNAGTVYVGDGTAMAFITARCVRSLVTP